MIGEDSGISIGLAAMLVCGVFGLWWRIEAKLKEGADARRELEHKQAAFELKVAEHYASDDRLEQMETKFTAAIDKLINRFDAFATDFHRIVGRLDALDRPDRT